MNSRLLRLFVEPPATGGGPRAVERLEATRDPGAVRPGTVADAAVQETAEFDAVGDEARAFARPSPASTAALGGFAAVRAGVASGGRRVPRASWRAVGSTPAAVDEGSRSRNAPPPRWAVLGSRSVAAPVAAGLALVARRQAGAAAAVVVVAGGARRSAGSAAAPPVAGAATDRESGSGTRAARRLAATLDGLGVDAIARGRVVWASVTVADARGTAALERIAALGAPQVLLVAAARTDALDEVLVGCDVLVHVTSAPEHPLAVLLARDAGRPGAPAVVSVVPLGWPARLAVRSGRVTPRGLARLVTRGAEVLAT